MKRYELNHDGKFYMETVAENFREARLNFADEYYGPFTMVDLETSESRNVRL
jgi:hypothetical protein